MTTLLAVDDSPITDNDSGTVTTDWWPGVFLVLLIMCVWGGLKLRRRRPPNAPQRTEDP